MSDDMTELKLRLEEAFKVATKLYQERGFQRRIGFGRKPALVNVDLANAWTRPGNPFSCDDMDDRIIPGVQRLLEACRANGHLVVHVTTCYQNTNRDDPNTDMGLWHHKIPVEAVDQADTELWAIDSRIAPGRSRSGNASATASPARWIGTCSTSTPSSGTWCRSISALIISTM